MVEKPVAAGPFLGFFFKTGPLTKFLIPTIRNSASEFGKNYRNGLRDPTDPKSGKKTMIVEFSSPNIAKPFHAGHLRSTIIGGFLSKLYAGAGWDVRRINYLGDWGKQYGLLALAWEKWGDEEALTADPINHLFNLYVRINQEMGTEKENIDAKKKAGEDVSSLEADSLDEQARRYFRRMTDGEPEAVKLWQRFRDLSIVRYKKTYARLNIEFDVYSGESQVPEEDMANAAKIITDKGISEDSAGAVLIDFSKHVPGKAGKSLEKAVIRKKDGTALYLTRDISELTNRYKKYNFDHMIYVVASQQDLHLKQLFKTIELMGDTEIANKCQHINFGMVLGMSTRKGTVKFLDDILRDVGDTMHEVMKKNEDKYAQIKNPEAVADILGISSVMVQDMTGKRYVSSLFMLLCNANFLESTTTPSTWRP